MVDTSQSPALVVMVTVPDRSAQTLLPIMQRHLRSGTKVPVYSDSWAAYRDVQQLSAVVQHQMVNHSLNFVHPVTGVQTQNVESYWVHNDMLTSYMDEFMWRERHGGSSAPTVMASMCRDISLKYPQ